jgi:hypothetical protein
VYNYEFLNSWKGFCTDANMRLGTTPSLEHIMANVDAEQERRALTRYISSMCVCICIYTHICMYVYIYTYVYPDAALSMVT